MEVHYAECVVQGTRGLRQPASKGVLAHAAVRADPPASSTSALTRLSSDSLNATR